MPFSFSLAAVLRLKESIEKREEVALESIHLRVARARREMDELADELTRAWQEREKALRKPVQANRLLAMQVEIDAAVAAKQAASEAMQKLQRQRDAQMKSYKIAHRQRQMLTDLRAQKKTAYEQEQARRQQKTIDDVVAARWQRR
jgi:flagellar export protein FliJ